MPLETTKRRSPLKAAAAATASSVVPLYQLPGAERLVQPRGIDEDLVVVDALGDHEETVTEGRRRRRPAPGCGSAHRPRHHRSRVRIPLNPQPFATSASSRPQPLLLATIPARGEMHVAFGGR